MTTRKEIMVSELIGYCAMWATRQSPYLAPDNLTKILSTFKSRLEQAGYSNDKFETCFIQVDKINDILNILFLTIPEVREWNNRKNGNQSPYGFVSRYSKPNPDDDFIDLDALRMNIVASCKKEAEKV